MLFAHRLALALGKTVGELMRDVTGPELMDWATYFEIAPPDEQDDWRMAMICSTLARLKGHRMKARDFMPKRRVRKQTGGNQKAMFRNLTG